MRQGHSPAMPGDESYYDRGHVDHVFSNDAILRIPDCWLPPYAEVGWLIPNGNGGYSEYFSPHLPEQFQPQVTDAEQVILTRALMKLKLALDLGAEFIEQLVDGELRAHGLRPEDYA